LITCNLTKPESTFETIRKAYKDLKPTDAALIATALVEAGRFAIATHDGQDFEWLPSEHEAITKSVSREVNQVQEAIEPEKTKKAALAAAEESVTLTVHLKPSLRAGEAILNDREDLKTLLADILDEGVEYMFSSTDIGWHWTLERVNWATVSGGEMKRHIKFRAEFIGQHAGVELGPGGKKKGVKATRAAKAAEQAKPEPVVEAAVAVAEPEPEAPAEATEKAAKGPKKKKS